MSNEVKKKTSSAWQTKIFAGGLVKKIQQTPFFGRGRKEALVFAFCGGLGSGKTTFIQGIAKELGVKEKILSPTFTLIRRASIPSGGMFFHMDCYRAALKDFILLGVQEVFLCPDNVVCVEWADKIKGILPSSAIWLNFKTIKEKEREITVYFPEAALRKF